MSVHVIEVCVNGNWEPLNGEAFPTRELADAFLKSPEGVAALREKFSSPVPVTIDKKVATGKIGGFGQVRITQHG